MQERGTITIHTRRGSHDHFGEYGESRNLLDYLLTKTPFGLAAPCGGRGLCGKCRVHITSGKAFPPGIEEKNLIGEKNLERGMRLACLTVPAGDISVLLQEERKPEGNKTQLVNGGPGVEILVRKDFVSLPPPHLHDQRSDHSRITRVPGFENASFPLAVLEQLSAALRKGNWSVTVCRMENSVLSVEPGDTRGQAYGLAVDIGTTTVASYLIDLSAGKNIDVMSGMNAQEVYGADVISRIQHASESPAHLHLIREKILRQIDFMVEILAERNGIPASEIYLVVLTGNTTMIHLALGLPAANIAAAPFISVSTESMMLSARELDLSIAPGGLVLTLPGVSGYVGADIVSAVYASGMFQSQELSLLIDIGTNGEIVLGNKDKLVACSTAAGPAFEGAEIRCGIGGTSGAINTVSEAAGTIVYSTISGQPPIGLCGSGLVDLLALLLDAGLVEDSGRMLGVSEGRGLPFSGYLGEVDGEPAVLLAPEESTGTGLPIVFTQKDVREIQLAKAAIAAGVSTLTQKLGISFSDIKTLYLAGGFGSYINKDGAVRIGLFPAELAGKVKVLGNAAGQGAVMALLSKEARMKCEKIRSMTEYVELSSSPEFQDNYIEEMMFPQENTKTRNIL